MPRVTAHFDGEPDTFRRVRALFPAVRTARIVADRPVAAKFRHSRLKALAERALARLRRTA